MKKKILFAIALAGLVLGSCSKDVIDNGGNNGGASWNEKGTGFISFDLNMPSVNDGSRAEQEYPSFDDGENKEYEVKDATLFLFTKGTEGTEAQAKLHSVYSLELNGGNKPNEQITTSKRIVREIVEIDDTDKEVYALVVLNKNGLFDIVKGDDSDAFGNKLSLNSTTYGDDKTSLTFDVLNEAIAAMTNTENTAWNSADKGFLMSNATLFNNAGGNTDPTTTTTEGITAGSSTLVKINTKYIFPTEQEAIEQSAASIYVERAQAKIQVKNGNANSDNDKIEIKDDFGRVIATYYYELTSWCIDNYNTKSYLTRKFDDTWANYKNAAATEYNQYRFVDSRVIDEVRMTADDTKRYRTYWGKDVNYDTSTSTPTLTKLPEGNIATGYDNIDIPIGESGYCFENTSAIDGTTGIAKAEGLTRVIIEAKLRNAKDGTAAHFFTESGDRSLLYIYDTNFADGTSHTYKNGTVQKKIVDFIMMDDGVKNTILTNKIQEGAFYLTVNFPNIDNTMVSGQVTKDEDITVTVTATSGSPTWTTTLQSAVDTALGETSADGAYSYNIDLDFYKDGKCYYQTYIRHFNDSEAPLVDGSGNRWTSDFDKNLLGRYGVLRNNWYVLSVNKISAIGTPDNPAFPENPDVEKFYISVDINILAWAKREQSVDL